MTCNLIHIRNSPGPLLTPKSKREASDVPLPEHANMGLRGTEVGAILLVTFLMECTLLHQRYRTLRNLVLHVITLNATADTKTPSGFVYFIGILADSIFQNWMRSRFGLMPNVLTLPF